MIPRLPTDRQFRVTPHGRPQPWIDRVVQINRINQHLATDFPIELTGIIQPNEFSRTINHIDHAIRSSERFETGYCHDGYTWPIILACIIIGVVLIATEPSSNEPVLAYLGAGIVIFGLAYPSVKVFLQMIVFRTDKQLYAAVESENNYYNTRSFAALTYQSKIMFLMRVNRGSASSVVNFEIRCLIPLALFEPRVEEEQGVGIEGVEPSRLAHHQPAAITNDASTQTTPADEIHNQV